MDANPKILDGDVGDVHIHYTIFHYCRELQIPAQGPTNGPAYGQAKGPGIGPAQGPAQGPAYLRIKNETEPHKYSNSLNSAEKEPKNILQCKTLM